MESIHGCERFYDVVTEEYGGKMKNRGRYAEALFNDCSAFDHIIFKAPKRSYAKA